MLSCVRLSSPTIPMYSSAPLTPVHSSLSWVLPMWKPGFVIQERKHWPDTLCGSPTKWEITHFHSTLQTLEQVWGKQCVFAGIRPGWTVAYGSILKWIVELRSFKRLLTQSLPNLFPPNRAAPSLHLYWFLSLKKENSTHSKLLLYL